MPDRFAHGILPRLERYLSGLPLRRRLPLAVVFGVISALGQAPLGWTLAMAVGLWLGFGLLTVSGTIRRAALAGWAFGSGYFALSLMWIVEPFLVDPLRHGWMAPFALVLMSAGMALFWGAAFGVARALRPINDMWLGTVLAVTLAMAELLRAYVLTGFPWAMPAYGLVDWRSAQLAAWVGPHGLNLILFVCLGMAASVAHQAQIAARMMRGLGIVATILICVVPMPHRAPNDPPAPDGAAVIRLIQPNADQHLKWDPEMMPVFFDRQIRFTAAGSADNAPRPDLVIWSETAVPVSLNASEEVLGYIKDAAQGVPVVLGINRWDGDRLLNSAVYLDGTGQVTQIYDKHHLVPFGEYVPFGDQLAKVGIYGFAASQGQGYSAGPGPQLMDLGPLGAALALICYEAVFPQDMRGTPTRPAFLMQITNDAWFGKISGPYQHLAQARFRAIEQGLPMVRVANTGVSAMIDAKGRVTEAIPLGEAGWVDAPLPARLDQPFYAKTGDLPILALLVVLLSGFGLHYATMRRSKAD